MIAGIDEAGRGPLAGPVTAAAVILPEKFRHKTLRDSKQLSALQRDRIYAELIENPKVLWAVATVTVEEIDRFNILRASHMAMRVAVAQLQPAPEHVLIDGLPVKPFPIEQTAVVDGDAKSLSIAAASVIAKVTRDRLMLDFDAMYPAYGFAQHKGYGTEEHRDAVLRLGRCVLHREMFLRKLLAMRVDPAQMDFLAAGE